jgi:hypothetical protein
LAWLEPIAKGLHINHWTSRHFARQAVQEGIVPAISDRTVRTILGRADLQPHRTRYWRTSRIDAHFQERAEKILWYYAAAEPRARRGYWSVENACHWTLDVTFREDDSRVPERMLGSRITWLYRFTLSIIKQHPDRRQSLIMQRRAYGWSDEFLMEVIDALTC